MITYSADVFNVVDGDTFDAIIHLPFEVSQVFRIRLYGINTPEVRGSEKAKGKIVKNIVSELILDKSVEVEDAGKGKFGRALARVYMKDGEMLTDLTDYLLENGLGEVMVFSADPEDLMRNYNSTMEIIEDVNISKMVTDK